MRRSTRLTVFVVLVLACATSTVGYAQFGRLKSLAKDKLGVNKAEQQKSTQEQQEAPDAAPKTQSTQQTQGSQSNGLPEGYGEAKATYAPGVTPNTGFDVNRRGGPTPEARVAGEKQLEPGKTQDVVFDMTNIDATGFAAVRGYKPCNNITAFQVMSAKKVKLTIALPEEQQSGSCYLYFRSAAGKTVFSANAPYLGVREAKERAKMEEMQRQARLPMDQQAAIAKKKIGKLWAVEFATGKKDTWSFVRQDPDNPVSFKFKNVAGKTVEVNYMAGNLMISAGENCMMQAQIEGTTASGVAIGEGCGVPMATKWTANIQ